MKKLVLVPYDKSQGILAKTRSSKMDGNSRSSSTRMTEMADDVIVTPPPPRKCDIPPGRRPKMTSGKSDTHRDWIHFRKKDNKDEIVFCILLSRNKHTKLYTTCWYLQMSSKHFIHVQMFTISVTVNERIFFLRYKTFN